jgi:hypothetical protein
MQDNKFQTQTLEQEAIADWLTEYQPWSDYDSDSESYKRGMGLC